MARKSKTASVVEQESSQEKRYVIKQIRVDALNIIRRRVEITPAVCDECGEDLCRAAKLPPYEDLDPKNQALVKLLVQKHKEAYHEARPAAPAAPVPLGVEDDESVEE